MGRGEGCRPTVREKSASFHGQIPVRSSPTPPRQMRRPKTVPDLLAGRRAEEGGGGRSAARRVPSKVLVNVTVQRSLGAVQVMASTDWSVKELVASTVRQYVKEGRRPLLLPSADPSGYGLHYSQFSLECLDPEGKLIGLGSRNFFLCPTVQKEEAPTNTLPPPSPSPSSLQSPAARSCSEEAKKGTVKTGLLSWFTFMDYLL